MRHLALWPALVAGALVLAAGAHGGGFATVGFAPLPDETGAGGTWSPRITVLQHGETPLSGLIPLVTIESTTSGETHTFTASETSEAGVYRAHVVFPAAGSWGVTVESGFWGEGGTVTYGPVSIEPSGGPSSRSFPTVPAVAAVALGLLATMLVGLRGIRRLRPAVGG